MPPKVKYTKDEIIWAALDLAREGGIRSVTARGLAERLGCSVKPIFGLFENMEEVLEAVLKTANQLYESRLEAGISSGKYPPYKASGMAYIQFAKEERELFKLLFMRDRSKEFISNEEASIRPLLELIERQVGITREEAKLFHLEMWVYVHGIATMVATAYLELDESLISQILTDGYLGLVHRYREKRDENDSNRGIE